jgi:hypothetical protein
MAMGSKDKQRITQILNASGLSGNLLFFFDTTFLLENVSSLAGWNHTRLEAAIAPRVEKELTPADVRFVVENGFYVAFGTGDYLVAWDTAKAICDDIFRHFYGHGDYDPNDVNKFCHQSSARQAAEILDISLPSENAFPARAKTRASVSDELPEGEKEKRLFNEELLELFLHHFNAQAENGKFVFSPCWDSNKEAITSFWCDSAADTLNFSTVIPVAKGLPTAIAQCKLDITALAVATRGIRHLLSRGDVGAISAPLHVETLSWVKTRQAYMHVLAKIEPQYRMLLAPRITGLTAGSNSTSIAQWLAELRRYVRHSFIHLANVDYDFSRDGVLGVTGFVSKLSSSTRAPKPALSSLDTLATKLRRICINQSSVACVLNVASAEQLLLLKSRGVRFISGPIIAKPAELPGPVGPLSFVKVSPEPEVEIERRRVGT